MLSQFLGNLQKQTKGLEVSQEQAQNGYSTYTENLERALCALNRQLYRNSDPQECALETLKTACDFYDGDWAGIIIVDFNLHIWSPLWWYNKSSDDKTTLVLNSLESSEYLDRWVRAMRTNHPIAIHSTDNKKSLSQTEYDLYQRLHAHSLLAVPFKPHPMGFLVIRNPQRYMYRINMLRTLAYFAENAINRWKLLERTKLIKHPKDIQHENEIIINVFGTFEIHTSCGVLTQDTIKSPIMCRLLLYLLLHKGSPQSPQIIADALWPDSTKDYKSILSNLRGALYRFRIGCSLATGYDLVEYCSVGYRFNSNFHIMTDMDNFDLIWQAIQRTTCTYKKTELIKQAINIYKGDIYPPAQGEHWLISTSNLYALRYIALVNELLSILNASHQWEQICEYAGRAILVAPADTQLYFWIIYGMYKMGSIEMAKGELKRARQIFAPEEYQDLLNKLSQFKKKDALFDAIYH